MLVTRPERQAEGLCELIESAGGRALRFPTIDILPPADAGPLQEAIQRLAEFDVVLFISSNAVSGFLDLFADSLWPVNTLRGAIGLATANALNEAGLPAHLVAPPPHNSEAMLELPALQNPSGKRILIMRGDPGRELLAESLFQCGAEITQVQSYQRGCPNNGSERLLEWLKDGLVDIISVTSDAGLTNLFDIAGEFGRQYAVNKPLLVLSQRTQELAVKLGFPAPSIFVARNASNQSLIDALLLWHRTQFK